jgi:hemoglobin-like flavoprotein
MTIEQIGLIQQSFKKVLTVKKAAAKIFYDRLFELDPSLRPLFKGNMEKQGQAFMSMLEMVVGGLDKFDDAVPALRALGERHISYRVQPEHYIAFEAALLWTLEQVQGSDFTSETKAAWQEVYALLSNALIELPSSSTDPSP